MLPQQVHDIVRRELAAYRYDPPPSGTTVGVPFSSEKMQDRTQSLLLALVTPYPQVFELAETYEECTTDAKTLREYWVVAETTRYLQWYDPAAHEYGLGQRRAGSLPISIGVRGDLVGVFSAM